jgi:hypothetical protein
MLYVVGDSHVIIYSGLPYSPNNLFPEDTKFPNVKVRHIGPKLAYHLMNSEIEIGKNGQIILDLLKSLNDITALLFSSGEIDIRTQAIKQSEKQSISLRESTEIIAKKIIDFLKLLRTQYSFPIFIDGIKCSGVGDQDPNQPKYGDLRTRNLASLYFDAYLKTECYSIENCYYISVIDDLITSKLETKADYLIDGCHLNEKALALIKYKFGKIAKENNIQNYFL